MQKVFIAVRAVKHGDKFTTGTKNPPPQHRVFAKGLIPSNTAKAGEMGWVTPALFPAFPQNTIVL